MVSIEQEEKIVITLSIDEAHELLRDLNEVDPTKTSSKIIDYLENHLTI